MKNKIAYTILPLIGLTIFYLSYLIIMKKEINLSSFSFPLFIHFLTFMLNGILMYYSLRYSHIEGYFVPIVSLVYVLIAVYGLLTSGFMNLNVPKSIQDCLMTCYPLILVWSGFYGAIGMYSFVNQKGI